MKLKDQKITIIGAGIGGLAAALAFSQQGAKVTVLEQADAIAEVGAGIQVSPNGVAVLRALGLADDLAWCSQRGRAVVLRSHRYGREVLRLDLDHYSPGQNFYFVHRADLIGLFADAVRRRGVRVRLLQKVDRISVAQRSVVHLANGAQCGGDLVVGADGLHSRARIALNGASAPGSPVRWPGARRLPISTTIRQRHRSTWAPVVIL